MITTIYLIRHSETIPKNIINHFDNNNNLQELNEKLILSIKGETLAQKLSESPELQNIDFLYSSNFVRAISTAKYIANKNQLTININNNFNERNYGNPKLEEKTIDFWIKQYLQPTYKNNNGESQIEVRQRMLNGLNDILKAHQGKRIVIISHATAISFLLLNWCQLKDINKDKKRHITFNNKTIINDKINSPEIFKLIFKENKIIDINLIR